MTFDEFIEQVHERGGFDTREHAERATRATLAVLGQRLAGGEPSDLAAQLPGELAELARYDGPAELFGTAEFYRRVADREGAGCTPGQAREHAMAVMSTVVDQVTEGSARTWPPSSRPTTASCCASDGRHGAAQPRLRRPPADPGPARQGPPTTSWLLYRLG